MITSKCAFHRVFFSPCIWVYVWFRFVFVWERIESKYVQEEGPIHILSQDTVNKKKTSQEQYYSNHHWRQRFNSTSKWSVLTSKHKYHGMHTHKKTHMKHITIATNLNGRFFVTRLAQVFHAPFLLCVWVMHGYIIVLIIIIWSRGFY